MRDALRGWRPFGWLRHRPTRHDIRELSGRVTELEADLELERNTLKGMQGEMSLIRDARQDRLTEQGPEELSQVLRELGEFRRTIKRYDYRLHKLGDARCADATDLEAVGKQSDDLTRRVKELEKAFEALEDVAHTPREPGEEPAHRYAFGPDVRLTPAPPDGSDVALGFGSDGKPWATVDGKPWAVEWDQKLDAEAQQCDSPPGGSGS